MCLHYGEFAGMKTPGRGVEGGERFEGMKTPGSGVEGGVCKYENTRKWCGMRVRRYQNPSKVHGRPGQCFTNMSTCVSASARAKRAACVMAVVWRCCCRGRCDRCSAGCALPCTSLVTGGVAGVKVSNFTFSFTCSVNIDHT